MKKLKHISSKSLPVALRKCLAGSTAPLRGVGGLLVAFTLLTSCSDEAISDPVNEIPESISTPTYLISLNVKTPASTRSTRADADADDSYTDEDGSSHLGTLTATNEENRIYDALIYFVSEDANRVEQIEVVIEADERYPDTDNGDETLVYEVTDPSDFLNLIGKSGSVYIVANSSQSSTSHNFTEVAGASNTKDPKTARFSVNSYSAPIGEFNVGGNALPLVNASKGPEWSVGYSNDQEEQIELIKGLFSSLEKGDLWWHLNDADDENTWLQLERAVARLEYHDLVRETLTEAPEEPDPSEPSEPSDPSDPSEPSDPSDPSDPSEEEPIQPRLENKYLDPYHYWVGDLGVQVKLYSLQPFNINKNSYLFRHTATGDYEAATGSDITATNADSGIFGIENGGQGAYNWVASSDWTYTADKFTLPATRSFLNALTISEAFDEYEFTASTDGVAEVTVPEFEALANGEDEFHPFAYVTENTLPSTDLMADYLLDEDDSPTAQLVSKYATGVRFKFIVLDTDNNPLQYKADADKYPSEVTNSTTSTMPANGKWITITDPLTQKWVDVKPEQVLNEDGEYETVYCLNYIACIVHNNMTLDGYDYAPMYYGVVRNNTYQIRVNSILGLPLPQDPRTLFLRIECNVKDWNVRWDDNVTLY